MGGYADTVPGDIGDRAIMNRDIYKMALLNGSASNKDMSEIAFIESLQKSIECEALAAEIRSRNRKDRRKKAKYGKQDKD